jgi:hypothetical protein
VLRTPAAQLRRQVLERIDIQYADQADDLCAILASIQMARVLPTVVVVDDFDEMLLLHKKKDMVRHIPSE